MNVVFLLLNMGLIKMSGSSFKQSRNSMLITKFFVLGVFCKFLGDVWVYLGEDSFSQKIGTSRRNKKF